MTNRRRLTEAHVAAAAFYRRALLSPVGDGPRRYLGDRGLERLLEDRRWLIGYAPAGWTNLLSHLEATGFSPTEIHAAGLAVETRRGTLIDRFRERLMLGIHNPSGELVGFVGRCAPRASAAPKYLNSPATELFAKGRQLFGLAEQSERLKAGATPVIVEGPLDVLAVAGLHDQGGAGFAAVSACGVTLRPEQAALLRAHSAAHVVVAYDGDAAGHRAARTAYHQLRGRFDRVWSARLPDNEDPASLAGSDPAALLRRLRTAAPLADQLVADVLDRYQNKLDSAEARVCGMHEATRLIASFAPSDVSRQVIRVARRLDMPPSEVTRDLTDAVSRHPSTARGSAGAVHRKGRTTRTAPRPTC